VACVVLAADALLRLATDGPLPQATAVALHQARCVSLALVGGALAMTGWARLRRHGRLLRLAADLDASPNPGTYAASLGQALGDPTLRITYPVSGQDGVDEPTGQPAGPPPQGQATTVLVRSGSPVATITHQSQHSEALAAALGPAARMAIDNERLQVQLRARLDELRASRERIVERGDAERLRLERDLHDGAQQRLLMIGYELHQASRADPGLAGALDPVNRDVGTALDELRDIAHGIYPGILESLGLPAALGALADGPVPVEVHVTLAQRLPAPAERAVYHVVSTALVHPHRTEDGFLGPISVLVGLHGTSVQLHLSGLGGLPPALVQTWEDHLGALGGGIHVCGPTVEGWVPCG
jgi:signal transduction histidine kinase